jgi:hypothetical protein
MATRTLTKLAPDWLCSPRQSGWWFHLASPPPEHENSGEKMRDSWLSRATRNFARVVSGFWCSSSKPVQAFAVLDCRSPPPASPRHTYTLYYIHIFYTYVIHVPDWLYSKCHIKCQRWSENRMLMYRNIDLNAVSLKANDCTYVIQRTWLAVHM